MRGGSSRLALFVLGLAVLAAFVPASPTAAQVYEFDSSGDLATYDRPTVFTRSGAKPIDTPAISRLDGKIGPAESIWPHIDGEAQRNGLQPALLRAVAWQESRGRAGAVSPKGAVGVMQLMPATAAALGVDPLDVKDNLRGGALYLKQQLARFGSVPLALAAYNAGPAAVTRYGGVPPFRETRLYVASIMARLQPDIVEPLSLIQIGNSLP